MVSEASGQARVTLLDVGQGLSIVVETAEHTLVYDTGPRFRSGFDTGSGVVAPYLQSRGIAVIDLLVISHGDNPKPLALNQLDDRFSASPAVVGKQLFLRGARYLYCIEKQ